MHRIVFILFLFLIGCSTAPRTVDPNPHSGGEVINIFVANHGWHTGLIFPSDILYKNIPDLKTRFGSVDYIEIGWGDSGYYQANQITTKLTLNAIFWPSDAVLYIVGFDELPSVYFKNSVVLPVSINRNQSSTMVEFISNSFEWSSDGHIIPLRKGTSDNSQFYSATGKYYAFNTCNKWTAKALYSGGVDILLPPPLTDPNSPV